MWNQSMFFIILIAAIAVAAIVSTLTLVQNDGYHRIPTRNRY